MQYFCFIVKRQLMARKPNMFNKIFRNKKITALLFVAVFGGVGGAYIMFSKAATVAPRVAMAHWRNYGYWIAASDGQVQNFGKAKFYGSPKKSGLKLAQGITDIAARRDGTGYWLLGGDGGIFAYGGAKYLGKPPANNTTGYYRAIVSTPTGNGYWVISKLGTGYAFGDAKTTYKIDYSKNNYEVVLGTIKGVDTIVDADHVGGDGKGLFILDRNGKVYVAGTAKAYYAGGSGTLSSGEQASGITADITTGYLITTNKGRVVARGKDVKNVGSVYGKKLGGAITGVQKIGRSSDLSTYGYWLVGRDGGVFAYGKVTYHGAKPVNLTPTTSTSADPCKGDIKGNIKLLQQCLNKLGANPKLVEDGILGPKTRQACKDVLKGFCPHPPITTTTTGGGTGDGSGGSADNVTGEGNESDSRPSVEYAYATANECTDKWYNEIIASAASIIIDAENGLTWANALSIDEQPDPELLRKIWARIDNMHTNRQAMIDAAHRNRCPEFKESHSKFKQNSTEATNLLAKT